MKRTQYSSLCEINITSLVDVMMVLLIIFMLTAPFIQAGIKVQLPKAKSTVIKEQEGVVVSIQQDGEVFLDNVRVPKERLAEEFIKLKVSGEERVFIRADKAVQYGVVMDVIGNIKEVGIDEVGMITEKK
ncbi:MAG: biopolymer transporter ExbD [Chitinivibrionia bacterium]|nr:biopolymer transporter ExbD [Chitinivibrionia bacterium]